MLKSKRSLSSQTTSIKYRRWEIPASPPSRVNDYSKLRVHPDEACGCIAEHTSANISYDVILFSLIYLTRQSVAVQREGASRLAKVNPLQTKYRKGLLEHRILRNLV